MFYLFFLVLYLFKLNIDMDTQTKMSIVNYFNKELFQSSVALVPGVKFDPD